MASLSRPPRKTLPTDDKVKELPTKKMKPEEADAKANKKQSLRMELTGTDMVTDFGQGSTTADL